MASAHLVFDSYLMVDWSASARPKTGRDSIWLAHGARGPEGLSITKLDNLSTRDEALRAIEALIEELPPGRRMLAGFDFPFGYSSGTARSLTGRDGWAAVWERLAEEVEDDGSNRNNRFEAAARLNREGFDGRGPFWAHPNGHAYDGLPARKPDGFGARYPEERRQIERRLPRTKPGWQLAGAGAAGGQALTGIPALWRLRERHKGRVAVWPFEGEAARAAPIVLAEIYPSMVPLEPDTHPVKDAAQVEAMVRFYAGLDEEGALSEALEGPRDLDPAARKSVVEEEGWILGAETVCGPKLRRPAYAYCRDPKAIYAASFAAIEKEADLSRLDDAIRPVALRLIHACGMTDLAGDIVHSPGAVSAGRAALSRGAPILCDARMVAAGIIARALPADNAILCPLAEEEGLAVEAEAAGTTRSAAAIARVASRLGGSVVVIGNAPTALFRLLELVRDGAAKPALVIGCPVGFIGAAESKQALANNPFGLDFIAVRGRRGGSAMAAAAVNALALLDGPLPDGKPASTFPGSGLGAGA